MCAEIIVCDGENLAQFGASLSDNMKVPCFVAACSKLTLKTALCVLLRLFFESARGFEECFARTVLLVAGTVTLPITRG